jgi:2-dehydropantoate 2-reductase
VLGGGDDRVFQAQGLVVMRIAVVGAGGVGGYFGAKLARAGESVVMLARGPHLAAIRRDGLRVRSAPEGDLVAKVDAVDTRAAAEALRPRRGRVRLRGHRGAGRVAHTFAGRIVFGELDGRVTERATRLRDALARAGIPVELSTDVRRVLWEKYLLISAQAGMTALTRCPAGVLRETPESWRMYRAIVAELAALARASGVARTTPSTP